MELQLGLALPITHSHDHVNGFDLNNYNGLKYLDKERSFEDACGGKQTLPLLIWSGQPNEDDGRDGNRNNGISCKFYNREEEGGGDDDQVVGWPPIKSWRKKLLQDHQHRFGHDQDRHDHHQVLANPRIMVNNGEPDSDTFSMFVKVKMEGVAITRKINLSLYNCYHTLTNSLIAMFDKYSSCSGDKFLSAQHYTLTYQDKDGDWLLAGDVPWQTFVRSVKRLEIVKNG